MKALLSRQFVGEGFIDTYAYPASSSGLLISGWVSNVWIDQSNGPIEAIACFEGGSSDGEVTLNFFDRPDVHGIGLGIVVLLSLVDIPRGRLLSLLLISAGAVLNMRPAEQMCHVPTEQIAATFLATITNSDLTPARDQLNKLLFQASYQGGDTIADLPDQVLIEVDDTILCGDDSIILIGWLLARRGTIKAIRLHAARHILDVDIKTGLLWVERADVLESVGRTKGFADSHCGFIMRVPASCPIPKELYLEIETEAGDVGFKRIPSPNLDGIAAIKRILNDIDMKYADVDAIYDNIFGPAIKALNTERLRIPVQMHNVQFGQATRAPRYSIIIPLYRRIDFMEVQLALFTTLGLGSDVEIIYVLDDPPRIRDAQRLADSLYQRFSVPFKLICLSQNVGFAPANNIGVRASSGEYICFMNSDVFPDTNDWLGRLAAHLDADPTLGVVGPTLLFEDGAVQHQGMFFREQPQFGGWVFPLHKRKGMRPSAETGLVWEAAITGACMLMRRDDVLRYGAFDEAYIIGDFEDTDLCLRLRTNGLGAAVDLAVQMHHLERKSQDTAASNWRSNLTLYNAWIHQRRWAEAIRWLEPAI
jgi:GT2 family glycosyltransferase